MEVARTVMKQDRQCSNRPIGRHCRPLYPGIPPPCVSDRVNRKANPAPSLGVQIKLDQRNAPLQISILTLETIDPLFMRTFGHDYSNLTQIMNGMLFTCTNYHVCEFRHRCGYCS
jgi:hypothetical protein